MEYIINDTRIAYEPIGERHWGKPESPMAGAMDLTSSTSWRNQGFTIEPFYNNDELAELKKEIFSLLKNLWRSANLEVPDNFSLDQYHTIAREHSEHLAAIEKTKLLSTEKFPLGIAKLEKRISAICNTDLRALNPWDGQSIFHFRVIRPNSKDNNPLHRDVWLEDFKDCINLYIPIAGSNQRSSLILIPGSHHWPESRVERTTQGAIIDGVKFNVPAVTAISGEYSITRPDPKENEVLVFSPYLIHGGAVNLDQSKTRISIELRLWRK